MAVVRLLSKKTDGHLQRKGLKPTVGTLISTSTTKKNPTSHSMKKKSYSSDTLLSINSRSVRNLLTYWFILEILKRGQEPGVPEDEIIGLIQGYISTCHNESMGLMER